MKIYNKNTGEFVPLRVKSKKINIITGQEVATDEKIDSKQVFVKRIDCGALPNNSVKEIDTGLTNVSIAKPLLGYALHTNGTQINLPHTSTSSLAGQVTVNLNNSGKIAISTGSDRSGFTKSYIEFYYTKN